jgi:predicted transcriptional regulator
VVDHTVEGRHFVYRPTVSEDEVRTSMVGELVDRLFAGDAAALVSHLVADHDLDEDEMERLRSLLDEAEKRDEER